MPSPLSKISLAGKPYRRTETTNNLIRHALSLTPSQLIDFAMTSDDKCGMEYLVYMIRAYHSAEDPRRKKAVPELKEILLR